MRTCMYVSKYNCTFINFMLLSPKEIFFTFRYKVLSVFFRKKFFLIFFRTLIKFFSNFYITCMQDFYFKMRILYFAKIILLKFMH